eukprot:Selendium_serpulae@DN9502_c0_g1_i1.p2
MGHLGVEERSIIPVHTIPGQLTVIATTFSSAVHTTGGAFYLDDPSGAVVDCVSWGALPPTITWDCTDTLAGPDPSNLVYNLAPTTPGAYLGEVKGDYAAAPVAQDAAVCMTGGDPSAAAAFVGSNTATAFVNEIAYGVGFEIAVFGEGTYTLYVGDGTIDGFHEFTAVGTAETW